MTPEAPFQEVKQAVDLSKADIIVAVGRGIKSKDNLALAEKLAEALGADLAASRPGRSTLVERTRTPSRDQVPYRPSATGTQKTRRKSP